MKSPMSFSDATLKGQITRARKAGNLERMYMLQEEQRRRYREALARKAEIEAAQHELDRIQKLAWRWHATVSTSVKGGTQRFRA